MGREKLSKQKWLSSLGLVLIPVLLPQVFTTTHFQTQSKGESKGKLNGTRVED